MTRDTCTNPVPEGTRVAAPLYNVGVGNDKPLELQYYKNETELETKNLTYTDYIACDTDGNCVRFDASNVTMVNTMLQKMIDKINPDVNDFKRYLQSVDLYDKQKFKAKYLTINPDGFTNERTTQHMNFVHQVLHKDYFDYKNIDKTGISNLGPEQIRL